MNKIIFPFFIALLFLQHKMSYAQELPRSAFFGAMIADLNDSMRIALKLSSTKGTLVKKVVDGASAQKAGIKANDVLVSMDGEAIENTGHFLKLLKTRHGGDEVKITYYRKAKLQSTHMQLLPKPKETSKDHEIIYSSLHSGANHLRCIINKPKGSAPRPAVLLIGGVGCYSIDNPSNTEILSMKMWADSLSASGFVVLRVEKPGMGDSQGTPCNACDFETEKQVFLDGLKQLKSLPYVDKEKVFMAGFSMGGLIAPLIAQEEAVKGIIVYGTVGRNWLEYEMENSFRQQQLDGRPADSLDQFMRAEYLRLYGLFVENKMPEQIMTEHPETIPNFFSYPMRTEYFQQVAAVNVRELWMKTKTKVLALHGSSDFVSAAAEHQLIAETVNRYHPGNGRYVEIPKCDHWGLVAESDKESLMRHQSGLNMLPLSTSRQWLKENS